MTWLPAAQDNKPPREVVLTNEGAGKEYAKIANEFHSALNRNNGYPSSNVWVPQEAWPKPQKPIGREPFGLPINSEIKETHAEFVFRGVKMYTDVETTGGLPVVKIWSSSDYEKRYLRREPGNYLPLVVIDATYGSNGARSLKLRTRLADADALSLARAARDAIVKRWPPNG